MPSVGEISTLALNSPKYASLKTTVPMSVVKQWKLRPGDQLEWEWNAVNNEMILTVKPVKAEKPKKK